MRINILTNNDCPNSKAFNCPLIASRPFFLSSGVRPKFYFEMNRSLFDAEMLFINSNVFRPWWKERKDGIFKFLSDARGHGMKIFWFDTTDSTWCTQFEVLPYVDKFLKSQIFADPAEYLKRRMTGRIFTDYFNDLYKCGETETEYALPDQQELGKIGLSWNTCFENYTASRFGLYARARQKIRPLTANILTENFHKIHFRSPRAVRKIGISCRVGLSHSRPAVVAHRKAVLGIMGKLGVDCGKRSLAEYFAELVDSQLALGPFGVGEITLRDFEIIICGATLLKPEMNHMKTWPELFVPGKTFFPFKWDLSDLEETIEYCIDHREEAMDMAEAAQEVYRSAVSDEGMKEFADRVLKMVRE